MSCPQCDLDLERSGISFGGWCPHVETVPDDYFGSSGYDELDALALEYAAEDD